MAVIFFWPIVGSIFVVLAVIFFWLAIRLHLRWWPAWVLRLILIGLIFVAIFSPQTNISHINPTIREVLVIDGSFSVKPEARNRMQALAQSWQSVGKERFVVLFGVNAILSSSEKDGWPNLDGRASNLVSALDLVRNLLGGSSGKVFIATDGLVNSPDLAIKKLQDLVKNGDEIVFLPLSVWSDPNDVAIGNLSAPTYLWTGTPFNIFFSINGSQNKGAPKFLLAINGKSLDLQPTFIDEQHGMFRIPPQPVGLLKIDLKVESSNDPIIENNEAHTVVQVFESPKVLFVTFDSVTVNQFVQKLMDNGLSVDVISPKDLPLDVATLSQYKIIFLNNFLSQELDNEQMIVLRSFVSDMAGGLIFLGGRNSYSLGDYQNTVLEPILPVKLEPPDRPDRPPAAFLLVLDRSSSMGMSDSMGVKAIDLEREAAMRVVETVKPDDFLGLLTYEINFNWDIPFQRLGGGLVLRQAMDLVSSLKADGGTKIYNALKEAVNQLVVQTSGEKYKPNILLLSDGESYDGTTDEFQNLCEEATQHNITISTIALGNDADLDLMELIAKAGQGRFYAVKDSEELPRIMLAENKAARSDNIQQGETTLQLGEADHPILSGMSVRQLPTLTDYNALRSKANEGAEDVLVSSNFQDPILSTWQYGLGHVVAWMGDIGDEWTKPWGNPADEGLFWSQVIHYALSKPSSDPAQIFVQADPSSLDVETYLRDAYGNPINLQEVEFSIPGTDKVSKNILTQVGSGDYKLAFPRPPAGTYEGQISYHDGNNPVQVTVPFSVNPPDEFFNLSEEKGHQNINAWKDTLGAEIGEPETLLVDQIPLTTENKNKAFENWLWIGLIILIFWPIEILMRRHWLPWS